MFKRSLYRKKIWKKPVTPLHVAATLQGKNNTEKKNSI